MLDEELFDEIADRLNAKAKPRIQPGPPGPKGDPGKAGERGPAGPKGDKGEPGEVEEAPKDGQQYARQDGDWSVVQGGGGSVIVGGDGGGLPGPQGPAGPQGPQGDTGLTGATGAPGPQGIQGEPGVTLTGGAVQSYVFGTSAIVPPPMSGRFRLNNANQTLATVMWVHYVNDDGIDIRNYLNDRVMPTDTLYVQDRDDASKWQLYEVSAAITDSGVYATIPVTWRTGGGSPLLSNDSVIITRETAAQLVNIHVGPTPPPSPGIGDLWVDTT